MVHQVVRWLLAAVLLALHPGVGMAEPSGGGEAVMIIDEGESNESENRTSSGKTNTDQANQNAIFSAMELSDDKEDDEQEERRLDCCF